MHSPTDVKRHEAFPGSTLTKRFRRRRLLYRPRRPRWLNATATVSLLALAAILLIGALLNRTGATGEAADLIDFAKKSSTRPADLVTAGGRTHPIVVLGDVPGSGAAKRVAAAAAEQLALGPGLDVLVLDLDPSAQPYIDAFLEAPREDAGILLAHTQTIPGPNSDDYLAIYRRIWALNQKLGADRAITILAGGIPGWPPTRALAPRTEAEQYARRGAEMAQRIEQNVFARNPKSRILVFVDGYQALKTGFGDLVAGGGAPIHAQWLAAVLDSMHAGAVYSVLQDGPAGGMREGSFTTYTGTGAYQLFRDATGLPVPFAVPVGGEFHFLQQPILTTTAPGIQLIIEPTTYRLGDVVDGYVYLGPH